MGDQDERDDVAAFGPEQWVYCAQHRRPHRTGWCTVSVRDKVGLGIFGQEDAAKWASYEKCRALGLALGDTQRMERT